jgi:hypothetical protein
MAFPCGRPGGRAEVADEDANAVALLARQRHSLCGTVTLILGRAQADERPLRFARLAVTLAAMSMALRIHYGAGI